MALKQSQCGYPSSCGLPLTFQIPLSFPVPILLVSQQIPTFSGFPPPTSNILPILDNIDPAITNWGQSLNIDKIRSRNCNGMLLTTGCTGLGLVVHWQPA